MTSSTIDEQFDTIHEARVVRGEEERGARDFFRLPVAEKDKIRFNRTRFGYFPLGGAVASVLNDSPLAW